MMTRFDWYLWEKRKKREQRRAERWAREDALRVPFLCVGNTFAIRRSMHGRAGLLL